MSENIAIRRVGIGALIGAPILALIMYVVGTLLSGVLIGLALVWLPSEISGAINAILSTIIAMWVARRSSDVVFRDYSGRGVFLVFLSLSLILGSLALAMLPINGVLLWRVGGLVLMVLVAYWFFWRRDITAERTPQVLHDYTEKRGLTRLWEPLVPFVAALPVILFFLVGLVQLAAVADQLREFFNLPGILSWIAAFFVTYIPLVGSVVGFFGAKDVWGWETIHAALLCFGPFVAMVGVHVIAAAVESAGRGRFA